MSEKFVLLHEVNGVEVKRVVFSRNDLKQVNDGIRYAAVRDSLPERRKYYGVLNAKLWRLIV